MILDFHCPYCNAATPHAVGVCQVLGRCTTCFNVHYLGPDREQAIRQSLEPVAAGPYPIVTATRAMALSNAIYKTANSGSPSKSMTVNKLSQKTRSSGADKGIISAQIPIIGRSHGGFSDGSHVASVVVMHNPGETLRHSIYVVFRGSVGVRNDGGAGRDTNDQSINIDWRANLDNRHTPHATNPTVSVHQGFQEILGSYEHQVVLALQNAIQICGDPNYKIIVTGHSQGAAHAILFAYNEKLRSPQRALVCIPFSPPRIGNVNFALDFNDRFHGRGCVLPYDGGWQHSAYLMVRGNDPVTFGMKRSISKRDDRRNEIADRQYALKKGLKIQKWEKKFAVAEEPFFHPKCLIQISSPLPGALNHKPNWFRDAMLNRL